MIDSSKEKRCAATTDHPVFHALFTHIQCCGPSFGRACLIGIAPICVWVAHQHRHDNMGKTKVEKLEEYSIAILMFFVHSSLLAPGI